MGDLIVDILIESTIAFEHDLSELTSEVTIVVMESVNNCVRFFPGQNYFAYSNTSVFWWRRA